MRAYKDSNNLIWFGTTVYPVGSLGLSVDGTSVSIWEKDSKSSVFSGDITNLKTESNVAYTSVAEFLTACADFFVNASAAGGGSVTDFLLVDYWEFEGLVPPERAGMWALTYTGNDIINVTNLFESVYDVDVFVWLDRGQISETIIFVHPTTFERYKFNGDTMEVYDDVDEVVPKWLKWEALINYNSDSFDYLMILNADERDYFNIKSPLNINGGAFEVLHTFFDKNLCLYDCVQSGVGMPYFEGNALRLCGSLDYLSNTPVSIKQRLRGTPPKLLSAETNVVGDRVILTFDKKMTNVGGEIQPFIIAASGSWEIYISRNNITVDGNKLILTDPTLSIINSDNISVAFNQVSAIESIDFGLLQQFNSFPVTNNVPAPPQIVSVETNQAGTNVTIVFDKSVEGVSVPTDLYVDGSMFPSYYEISRTGDTIIYNCYDEFNLITYQSILTIDYIGFGTYNVTNNIPAPPQFVSAETNTSGGKIIVTFDINAENYSFGFDLYVNSQYTSTYFESSIGNTHTYVVDGQIFAGDAIEITTENGSFGVTNTVAGPAAILSAETSAEGDLIYITFDNNIENSVPGFNIYVNSNPVDLISLSTEGNIATYSFINGPIVYGDIVSVESFSGTVIATNNVSA